MSLGRTFWEAKLAKVGRPGVWVVWGSDKLETSGLSIFFPRCLAVKATVFLGPLGSQGTWRKWQMVRIFQSTLLVLLLDQMEGAVLYVLLGLEVSCDPGDR